jgi:hypothetical protein
LVERGQADAADTQGRALEEHYPKEPEEVIERSEAAAHGWNDRLTPFGWDGRRAARWGRARKRRHDLGGSRACSRRPIRRRNRRATAEVHCSGELATRKPIDSPVLRPFHRTWDERHLCKPFARCTSTSNSGIVCRMEGVKTEDGKTNEGGMRSIKERLRPYLDENPVAFKLEKWLQIHAGGHPAIYFNLVRLLRTRQNLRTRVVTPDTQLVIEGFPRSGNTFARRAFVMAQGEKFDRTRIASHLHVPAQVVQAARWQIPTLVLIRRPRDAVLSFALWNPISVDQALSYYRSFYETVEMYRDAYVLGHFEEITEDVGQVIKRVNGKFGTTFSLFRHDEENVGRVFADMDIFAREKYGETQWERKAHHPSTVKERMKHEIEYELENPRRKKLIAEAEAVYERLTNTMRIPASVE